MSQAFARNLARIIAESWGNEAHIEPLVSTVYESFAQSASDEAWALGVPEETINRPENAMRYVLMVSHYLQEQGVRIVGIGGDI